MVSTNNIYSGTGIQVIGDEVSVSWCINLHFCVVYCVPRGEAGHCQAQYFLGPWACNHWLPSHI